MAETRRRIGLVTGEFPPMQGGVGAFTQELAKALHAQGHAIHIVTHRLSRPAKAAGARYTLDELREPIDLGYAFLHAQARRWGWADVNLVARVAIRHELDVINLQYQAAAYNMRSGAINLAPWRLKGLAKTVVTFHDLRVPYLFPKAGRLRRLAVQFMARQAHGVIVTNREDYLALEQTIKGPICEIPIGSNIGVQTGTEDDVLRVRRKLGVRPVDFLLGYFGFLNESKGADLLLRAMARLDERFHLVFIGGRTGSSDSSNNRRYLERLEHLIEELGLSDRVHWTGFLADAEVSYHLNAADLLVMPYLDGVSLRRGTLMAALSHGRPTISTEPEYPIEPLRHGENVWLASRGDVDALAAAILHLAADSKLRAILGAGALRVAGHFSWDRIAERTAAFYEELLS